MRALRPWLMIGLLAVIGGWLLSLWLIEPARITFVLPSPDGKSGLRWSCTQPSTAAEAKARAEDAHNIFNDAIKDSVHRSMDAFKQTLSGSEPIAIMSAKMKAIDNGVMDELHAIAIQLEASHGCRPYLG